MVSRLEQALDASMPRAALQQVMADALEQGLERDEITAALETCRSRLNAAAKFDQAELISELYDGLSGWCRI